MTKAIITFKNEGDVMTVISKQYQKAIENFFGDSKLALEFGSNVRTSLQRNPGLIDCSPDSLLNSFMTMASLKLMPSGVSGEAFVLPYKGEAQFQLGYKGIVTLFYRAGIRSIVAEIVYSNDTFSMLNGEINHVFDPFSDNRGVARGAYVILELPSGTKIPKAMSKKEILDIGKKFSKSFSSSFSPWDEKNDPQLWMWKKTVLKQSAKLAPTNPELARAIAEDNKDSVLNRTGDSSVMFPAPKDDFSEQEETILGITKLEKLNAYFADLSAEAKIALKPIYDGQKAILEQEVKDSVV